MKQIVHHIRHHVFTPVRLFLNDSRSTGVILILCAVLSLLLTNASSSDWYYQMWHIQLKALGTLHLPETPASLINDFLMSFFFLFAGMEIKRELMTGELSSFQKAVLPFGAALGGMVVPAIIFLAFNANTAFAHGWGIPTATDIAFSLGIASLLGKRVPVGLKILLMALAIIDDLGAIIVIALFYGHEINSIVLGISALLYGGLIFCNVRKIKFGWLQLLMSFALWYCMLNSGIEAGITGVLVGFAMPSQLIPEIEKLIHGWVNFLIIPLFALANTAVAVHGNIADSVTTSVSLGVMFGLMLGKPIGIFLFSRLLVAMKIARLPQHVEWKQLFGMGILAGIGFTMSIFTTALAFDSLAEQNIAKIAILLSVLGSLIFSWIYFILIGIKKPVSAVQETMGKKSEAELALA